MIRSRGQDWGEQLKPVHLPVRAVPLCALLAETDRCAGSKQKGNSYWAQSRVIYWGLLDETSPCLDQAHTELDRLAKNRPTCQLFVWSFQLSSSISCISRFPLPSPGVPLTCAPWPANKAGQRSHDRCGLGPVLSHPTVVASSSTQEPGGGGGVGRREWDGAARKNRRPGI